MIFPETLKNITLYKLDLLLKKVIVDIYLQDSSEKSTLRIVDLNNKIFYVANKIYKNEEIEIEELKFVESLYNTHHPNTGSMDGELKNDFDFEEKYGEK